MFTCKNEPRSKSHTGFKWIGLLPMMMLFAAPLANADSIFVQLMDIQGESQDREYKDAIVATSWNWGMTQSGSMHMGAGGGTGKVNISDLTFTHYVDKASPKIMEAACDGRPIRSARLSVRTSRQDAPIVYLVIDMEDVLVSSVKTGGSDQSNARAMEEVTLNFARVKVNYRPVQPDGSAGPRVEYGWDIVANTKY